MRLYEVAPKTKTEYELWAMLKDIASTANIKTYYKHVIMKFADLQTEYEAAAVLCAAVVTLAAQGKVNQNYAQSLVRQYQTAKKAHPDNPRLVPEIYPDDFNLKQRMIYNKLVSIGRRCL